jgi:hypothetical protein
MAFLTPLFLLFGLLAGPVILLYMLRLRRKEILVSSTMLWRRLLRDREANAPWQRLRRNLLLLLQLLILFALVLALARPFLPIPTVTRGNVVMLLDASASMLATDVRPTRFEAAKNEVANWIDGLSGDSQMTIIQVGELPTVLASAVSDHGTLRNALASARPGPFIPDWEAALALAAGAAQGYRDAQVVIISDGALPDQLPALPVEVKFVPVGRSGENLAIGTLAVRGDADETQLFASVSNEGAVSRDVLLSVRIDGVLFDSRSLNISGGTSESVTWSLPDASGVVQATLSELENDFLELDDSAWAVLEGGVRHRALIVTEGNLFLEQAFSALPNMDTFKTSTVDIEEEEDGDLFDLIVYDGVIVPDPPPAADLFIINPQEGQSTSGTGEPLLTVTGSFSNTLPLRLADNRLLEFVDWRNVHVRQARRVAAPWAVPLVTAEGGALLLAGEQGGRRIAVMSFDLHDSDLPLQIAFPILMANISGWLSPGTAFDEQGLLRPGNSVNVSPAIQADRLIVVKPDGSEWSTDLGEQAIQFAGTDQVGLYQAFVETDGARRSSGSFAVNLFSRDESHIEPRASVRVGSTRTQAAAEGDVGQREFWPWLLLAALIILLAEWWVHLRGASVPWTKA